MTDANKTNVAVEKIQRICAHLKGLQPDSLEALYCHVDLQVAARELMTQTGAWDSAAETDVPQDKARQAYRSRESDSADGFAEGLKLFNPRKPDSDKKKD